MIVFMSAAYARDKFFPQKILSNLGCGLYTNAAYIRVFTVVSAHITELNCINVLSTRLIIFRII